MTRRAARLDRFAFTTLLALVAPCARAQTAYAFTTLAGRASPPGFVDGPGATARLNAPAGVIVDTAGGQSTGSTR